MIRTWANNQKHHRRPHMAEPIMIKLPYCMQLLARVIAFFSLLLLVYDACCRQENEDLLLPFLSQNNSSLLHSLKPSSLSVQAPGSLSNLIWWWSSLNKITLQEPALHLPLIVVPVMTFPLLPNGKKGTTRLLLSWKHFTCNLITLINSISLTYLPLG